MTGWCGWGQGRVVHGADQGEPLTGKLRQVASGPSVFERDDDRGYSHNNGDNDSDERENSINREAAHSCSLIG